MNWNVDTNEEFEARQKYMTKLIDEKQKKIDKLKFEIASLFFLYNTFKNNNWETKKYKKWCLNCKYNNKPCKKPVKCPMGNFDEYER